VTPFQGYKNSMHHYPGLCPGLVFNALSGLRKPLLTITQGVALG